MYNAKASSKHNESLMVGMMPTRRLRQPRCGLCGLPTGQSFSLFLRGIYHYRHRICCGRFKGGFCKLIGLAKVDRIVQFRKEFGFCNRNLGCANPTLFHE